MALIRFPEGQQRSGSSGGTVFSHNRYGAYIRPRSIPVNPNTDRQAVVRNAVKSLTIRWAIVLTQLQRDAWDLYAELTPWTNKFGDTVYLTGLNHYVRCNTPRVQWVIAPIDAAPTYFNLGAPDTNLSATASEATQQLTVDGDPAGYWIGEPDAWYFIAMGVPQNPGIKFFDGPWRQISALPGQGPPPFPAIIDTAWPFAEGQRIWVQTRVARGDGRLSTFARYNFLTAA